VHKVRKKSCPGLLRLRDQGCGKCKFYFPISFKHQPRLAAEHSQNLSQLFLREVLHHALARVLTRTLRKGTS
jgi:hypothetical protein